MPTTNDLNSDSTLNVTLILVRSATWFSKDSEIMSNKLLVLRLVCVDEEVKVWLVSTVCTISAENSITACRILIHMQSAGVRLSVHKLRKFFSGQIMILDSNRLLRTILYMYNAIYFLSWDFCHSRSPLLSVHNYNSIHTLAEPYSCKLASLIMICTLKAQLNMQIQLH